jgi:hypothetical protein
VSVQLEPSSRPTDRGDASGTAMPVGAATAPPTLLPMPPISVVQPEPPKPVLEDCTKDVDIVFVLDISGSMAPFFWALEDEIFVVDQALRALSLPHSPHYGLVVFVDDVMIDQEGAPHSDPESIRDAFEWGIGLAGLGQIKNPSEFNGTFVENSLDALYLAADSFQWRPAEKTHRMIIHVTDDTFWDGPTSTPGLCDDVPLNRTGCPTKGSVHTYHEVVAALRTQKIWTFAFAAMGRLLAAGLVDTQPGFFTPYQGRNTIPTSTGGSASDIFAVLDGTVSLSASINRAVIETQCESYPPVPPSPPLL